MTETRRGAEPAPLPSRRVRLGLFLWVQSATWADLRDAAIRAEAAGFDSLWISDHLIAPFPSPDVPVFEAWTTLAALAATTTRLRLGLLVGNNLLRHPGVVAKMAVTVDRISGGRLTIGLGSGWLETEATMHGLEFGTSSAARSERLEEAITVIRALTNGDPVDFEGAHYRLRGAVHRPGPLQPRLPVLIGGNGRSHTLRVVARHADAWHASGDAAELRELAGLLSLRCETIGRAASEIELFTHRWIRIRDRVSDAGGRLRADLVRHGVRDAASWLPLAGTPDTVAAGLTPLVDAGFRHLLVTLSAPFDAETIDRAPEVRARLE